MLKNKIFEISPKINMKIKSEVKSIKKTSILVCFEIFLNQAYLNKRGES